MADPLNKKEPPHLNYAPAPRALRQPLFSSILGILGAGFLTFFGLLLCYGCFAMIWAVVVGNEQARFLVWLSVFAPLGLIFLFIGILQFIGAFHGLRGTSPGGTWWELLLRFLNRRWFG